MRERERERKRLLKTELFGWRYLILQTGNFRYVWWNEKNTYTFIQWSNNPKDSTKNQNRNICISCHYQQISLLANAIVDKDEPSSW